MVACKGFTLAVVGYLVKDNQIILGLRKKVSLELGKGLISGIGGKLDLIDKDRLEDPDSALIREFKEEVKVVPTKFYQRGELYFIYSYKTEWNQRVFAYLIEDWSGSPTETEVIKPVQYKIDEIPFAKMWPDNRYYLLDILQNKKVYGKFIYGSDNKTVVKVDLKIDVV